MIILEFFLFLISVVFISLWIVVKILNCASRKVIKNIENQHTTEKSKQKKTEEVVHNFNEKSIDTTNSGNEFEDKIPTEEYVEKKNKVISRFGEENIDVTNINNEAKKKTTAEKYIEKFGGYIEKYDNNKILDDKFVNNLISKKELEYEKYIKYSGTTKSSSQFVVFDLETTGLSETKNEIIEIGAIRFEWDEPKQIFHTYVKPKKKITAKITSINGITNEMVENAPTIEEVLPKFIDFIKDDVLIAYNAPFDMKFILENTYKLGYKKIKNKVIDALALARRKIREYDFERDRDIKLESYKLSELNWRFMLNLPSHNAIDDCKVCAYVYLAIDREAGGICYVEI